MFQFALWHQQLRGPVKKLHLILVQLWNNSETCTFFPFLSSICCHCKISSIGVTCEAYFHSLEWDISLSWLLREVNSFYNVYWSERDWNNSSSWLITGGNWFYTTSNISFQLKTPNRALKLSTSRSGKTGWNIQHRSFNNFSTIIVTATEL